MQRLLLTLTSTGSLVALIRLVKTTGIRSGPEMVAAIGVLAMCSMMVLRECRD